MYFWVQRPISTKKIRYLLEEKGRYHYQRKVPVHLQQALKMDRWHLPVGSDFETATDRIGVVAQLCPQMIHSVNPCS